METRSDRPLDLRALENPASAAVPRGSALSRAEQEARTRRLLVVGAMASFVSFFGLAAAGDIASAFAPPTVAAGQVAVTSSAGSQLLAASGSSASAAGVASGSGAARQSAAVVTAPAAGRSTHGRTATS